MRGLTRRPVARRPFCPPEGGAEHKPEDLGEVLEGDRLMSTPYELPFRVDKEHAWLCDKVLRSEDLAKFRTAVGDDYYFQMYYDDLPIWGFLGKIEKIMKAGGQELRYFLFTHVHFDIFYNADHVIEINVSTDPLRTLDVTSGDGVRVEFSYSVKWKETAIPFERRMEKYSRNSFLPQHLEIHWFSIVNSCVTVLLLTGFLATILMRVLKNDFVKYSRDDEAPGTDDGEETGWKYIHGDVFRFPPRPSLFAAVVGTGTQLLVLTFCLFALALVGVFYPYNRGGLLAAMVVVRAPRGPACCAPLTPPPSSTRSPPAWRATWRRTRTASSGATAGCATWCSPPRCSWAPCWPPSPSSTRWPSCTAPPPRCPSAPSASSS